MLKFTKPSFKLKLKSIIQHENYNGISANKKSVNEKSFT